MPTCRECDRSFTTDQGSDDDGLCHPCAHDLASRHEGDGSCEDCGCLPTTERRLCHNCYEQGNGHILEEARGWLLSFNVTPEATREDLVRELGRLRRTLMKGVE